MTKVYRNELWLREKYWDEGLTLQEMADLTTVTLRTIANWMEKHDIPRRGKEGEENPMYGVSGEDSPVWEGGYSGDVVYKTQEWYQVKHDVRRRDNYKCQECGACGDNVELHAHHIIPMNKGGARFDPGNLVTLCRECHMAEHDD